MLSDDHCTVMAALKQLVRPATVLEVADVTDMPPFHARACLHQLARLNMVAGLSGKRAGPAVPVSDRPRFAITARGWAEFYEHPELFELEPVGAASWR